MPVVTQEAAAADRSRRRGVKLVHLLLLLPLLLLGFVGYAAFRPIELQLGTAMLLTAPIPNAGGFKGVISKPIPVGRSLSGADGRMYAVTGAGRVTAVPLGDRLYAVVWFQGHRK